MKLKTLILAAILMVAFIAPAFSQEMPAPGTVIDKNNFKKYAHLFPEEFAPAFMDGFGGIVQPIHANVVASTPLAMSKLYYDYSAKNKGKFGLDAQGNITGGWTYDGLPFPDLKPGDKDFATKYMWNYAGRYLWDDEHDKGGGGSFEKRKGEPLRWNTAESYWIYYKNRQMCSAKPNLENPSGLFYSLVFHYILPDSVKNTITLAYRYADMKKTDETYLYLPSMRRVLRAEAGQRSTPMLGSTNALDDFMGGFDGRTNDFTYTFIKEQKVLQVMDQKLTRQQARAWKKEEIPFGYDNYEIRTAYVIDVKPKDPRYPQSKKRLWIDKEIGQLLYAAAWDRAGKLWKVWSEAYKKYPFVGAEKLAIFEGTFGVDIQFGMASWFSTENEINTCKFSYNDSTPAALLKRAR